MFPMTAEESGLRVAEVLLSSTRVDVHRIVKEAKLTRAQVYRGIRWNRDEFGEEALVCNRDGTYEFALDDQTVSDYRRRRLSFIARSLARLRRVLEAGVKKFGGDQDTVLAIELIGTAVQLLTRGARVGGGGTPMPEPKGERVRS